jgi:hypothetical protein
MAYKKKAARKKTAKAAKSRKSTGRKSAKRRSKKDTGVVLWVENLFGMNTKKKAKGHRKAKRKASSKKSHAPAYSLKARKSSGARKKYAK